MTSNAPTKQTTVTTTHHDDHHTEADDDDARLNVRRHACAHPGVNSTGAPRPSVEKPQLVSIRSAGGGDVVLSQVGGSIIAQDAFGSSPSQSLVMVKPGAQQLAVAAHTCKSFPASLEGECTEPQSDNILTKGDPQGNPTGQFL